MKIILTINTSSPLYDLDRETFIRNLFSNVSHLVWVKKIQAHDEIDDQFIITLKPQGANLENESLARNVLNALKYRGDVRVNHIHITPTIQSEAVKQISENDYTVDSVYGSFLARNDAFRNDLLNKNILSVNVEYKQIAPNTFKSTGKIAHSCTSLPDNKNTELNTKNIYHCLAMAVSNDEKLRKKLIKFNVSEIEIHKNTDNDIVIDVISTKSFPIRLPTLEESQPKQDNIALSSPLNKTPISDIKTQDQVSSPKMHRR